MQVRLRMACGPRDKVQPGRGQRGCPWQGGGGSKCDSLKVVSESGLAGRDGPVAAGLKTAKSR